MIIKNITIDGFRGFSKKTKIDFAIPDGINEGSGLTVLVGSNNSGKSTVLEALNLFSLRKPTIDKRSRNILNKYNVNIEIKDINNNTYSIYNLDGGAFCNRKRNNNDNAEWNEYELSMFTLTNKRSFSTSFGQEHALNRENYNGNIVNNNYRDENGINGQFGGRLLKIEKNKEIFEEVLKKVIDPLPKWTIDSDLNGLYLEFIFDKVRHSSNGAGAGYINIFNIADALYDSSEENIILIDEPEISLHPDLQKKLFQLLIEYSKDKQIIISTHSPYFIDWNLFCDKSKIIRFRKERNIIKKYEIKYDTKIKIRTILNDYQKPHILSLATNDIFFLNDNVILTEGQDDVVLYPKVFRKYNFKPNASFFGWGAGGAERVEIILLLLKDLGYKKVFTILDGDKKDLSKSLSNQFNNFAFYNIAAKDIRNKDISQNVKNILEIIDKYPDFEYKENIIKEITSEFGVTKGIVKDLKNFDINIEYDEDIKNLINSIKMYFV